MRYTKPQGLERNAAVVPGNVGALEDVPTLVAAALRDRLEVEPDAAVRVELAAARRARRPHALSAATRSRETASAVVSELRADTRPAAAARGRRQQEYLRA